MTACEPGREFGFAVLLGDRPVNNWHYRLTPTADGTEVTESFRLPVRVDHRVLPGVRGWLRQRRNIRDMTKTLQRIKDLVEAG